MTTRITTLGDVLHAFIRESEEAFPFLAGRLMIYDARENIYYVSKNFDFKKHGFANEVAVGSYIANHETAILCAKKSGTIRAYADQDKRKKISLIFLGDKQIPKGNQPLSHQQSLDLLHTLDHELGHLVMPGGLYTPSSSADRDLLSENMAEAYAQLRHYQRFGTQQTRLTHNAQELARSFVFNSKSYGTHYYYPTTRAIEKRRNNIDFKGLSVSDIAGLARRFALEFTPSTALVDDLNTVFAPCRRAYKEGGMSEGLKALYDLIIKCPSPHVVQLGAEIFLACANDPAHALHGKEWAERKRSVNEILFRANQEEILYRVPAASTKSPKAQPPRT